MMHKPKAGSIVARRKIPELGVQEWILSNGARVLLKSTDFRADEILLRAYSWGGSARASDADLVAAKSALAISNQSGVGDFDALELRKQLAGRRVSASLWVSEQQEGLRGSSSREDLDRLFQLSYLLFTAPRFDPKGLRLYEAATSELLRNRLKDPGKLFSDTYAKLMWQDFPRYRPWTLDRLQELNLEKSRTFLQRRFANAGDFTFVVVGSFEAEELEPRVSQYLASLPGKVGVREQARDLGAKRNPRPVRAKVRRGLAPKSRMRFALHAPFENTRGNRYLLDALAQVLSVRLREELREELGGTYSVGAQAGIREQPVSDYTISIAFEADPARIETLSERMLEVVEEMRQAPLDARYIKQLQAQQRRGRETSLRSNAFWAEILQSYDQRGEDLRLILDFESLVSELSPQKIHQAAKKWLNMDRTVQVTLMPEGES